MQFFTENSVLDSGLLESLGMVDATNRQLLIDFFDCMLRLARSDVNIAFKELVHSLHLRVAELECCKEKASRSATESDEMKSRINILETRASGLSVVNGQLKEAIAAYKAKRDKYKKEIDEKDSAIALMRIDMAEYDARLTKCLADAGTVDASNRLRLKELEAVNLKHQEMLQARDEMFRRRMSFYRKEVAKIKQKWVRWTRNGRIVRRRCGCEASIRYFQKTSVDIELLTVQAENASVGFERELEKVAHGMRAQIQAVARERDAALSDCGVYIDRLLQADEDLRRSNFCHAALLQELSAAKAALSKRFGAERSIIRAHLFTGSDGVGMICPVPTMDGTLIPLADVYRGWMDKSADEGGGDGMESGFRCPVSGSITQLVPAKIVSLIFNIACMVDVDMSLPFKVQFLESPGAWVDFCFIDQLEIVSRICGWGSSACAGNDRLIQFLVFGAGCLFNIQPIGSGIARLFTGNAAQAGCGAGCSKVRVVGFDDFFRGCRLSFVEDAAVL